MMGLRSESLMFLLVVVTTTLSETTLVDLRGDLTERHNRFTFAMRASQLYHYNCLVVVRIIVC